MRSVLYSACAAVAVLALQQSAHATLLAAEDFSGYPTAAPLNGDGSAGNGWNDAWHVSASFGFFDVNGFVVSAGPKANTNVVASGNQAGAGFTRLFRDLSPTVAAQTAVKPTFVSFVGPYNLQSQVDLNISSDDDGSRTEEFAHDTSSANAGIETLNNAVANPVTDSMGNPVPGRYTETFSPLVPKANVVSGNYLYLIKVDPTTASATSSGTVTYYAFNPDTRPDPNAPNYGADYVDAITSTLERPVAFDRIGLFSIGSDGISNIRIADTFDDAVPLNPVTPEPASLCLLALGAAGLLVQRRRPR